MDTETKANPANVASATTPAALSSSAWLDGSSAPKDGTPIVAVGKVVYSDDCCTVADPFVLKVHWRTEPSEGWHTDDGLSVARMVGDEVIIHYWLPMPSNKALAGTDSTR